MPNGPSEQERRYISGDIKTGNILDVVEHIADQEERENFARKNKPLILMTQIGDELKKLNAGTGLVAGLLDSLTKMNARTIQLEESKISDFQTFFFSIPLIGTTRLVHLDLVKGERGNQGSKDVPSTAIVEYPNKPVRQIMIVNRGAGSVRYALGVEGRNSTRANIPLLSTESHTWSDQAGYASIRNINLVINGVTSATVEIVCTT